MNEDYGSRTERDAGRAEAKRAWIAGLRGGYDALAVQYDPRDDLDEWPVEVDDE